MSKPGEGLEGKSLQLGPGPYSSLPFAEILDFGYPQNSETGALKTFITQQGIKSQVLKLSNQCWGGAQLPWAS